ncbi:non-canonical purine NTP pyrophosphatase [Candidatus Falkowbacteria bacterium CG10_big_fil_rev_8_21_14_0_10_39_9]|uniref:Non-canonical purine NTP pyrophosphatase n=1 Tax=Candidatus Falkowbacteria bacterium CG10_big_fil_rev_8_21_14_0_10_39_9 TaxID=1974566 RepID=A0A2M6WR68_9BACT|nr:MAG: non-canonical purine NTP pyrophosphatase [Candidatus Falkowbacteria bacterium CG10_big_fil_rev_8_21_14_0_10_39_9]
MNNNQNILIATANHGKAEEIKKIFQGTDFTLKFLFDFPEELKDLHIIENANSFEGNALIKAIVAGDILNLITLADDSGLCVDALGGRPGIYSARYSGEGNDRSNYLKVLKEMKDVPLTKRGCNHNCSVAIYDPATKFVDTVSGIWEARVALEPKGNKSFGYAPIVMAKDFDYLKTNAEFDPEELISINHRGQAFGKAIKVLENYLKQC